MWFYLCSILTIGGVQTLTIGHPYRTLLAYDVIRSPDKTADPGGFLVYLDNSGIERIVNFNYAEPIYAFRRINFITSEIPIPKKFVQDDSSEINKAREAHFRAWSLQQYQVLKREIDFLKGEGREPPTEMLLKFLPLEKIALTSDYSRIAELPEIKRIREEHLNIWNNQVQQNDENKIKTGVKLSIDRSSSPEKMKAEELAYEDKIANVNQLKLQGEHFQNKDKFPNEVQNITSDTRFANKDHNRSEALKKEPSESNEHNIEMTKFDKEVSAGEPIGNLEDQNIKTSNNQTSEQVKILQVVDAAKTQEAQPETIVKKEKEEKSALEQNQTPNTMKLCDDHLDSLMESKKQMYGSKRIHSEIEKLVSTASTVYVPQQVVDTAEVMRARDEHLKIVNEAILKAKLAQTQEQQKEISTKVPDTILNVTELKV